MYGMLPIFIRFNIEDFAREVKLGVDLPFMRQNPTCWSPFRHYLAKIFTTARVFTT
jgi:hypothetical protein